MNPSKRIAWVDTVKYFCIIMVMLCHLESRTAIWNAFYRPFFLVAFLFVSGYVYRPKGNFAEFMTKKVRQLLVPWFVFSNFNIISSHVITFTEHKDLMTELKCNFLQVRDHGDGLWFVAALFVAFIPFYFFIKWYEEMPKTGGGTVKA